MSTKWDDNSWQEEFLEMKTHKPEVVRLLMEGPRGCLLYTSPSPRDLSTSRMPSSA